MHADFTQRSRKSISMKKTCCVLLAVLAFGFASGAAADETTCVARGVAFVDENRNGARDEGEPGLPGVQISDSDIIVTTDSEGHYQLETTSAIPNTVFVINPNGYRVTTPFYHLVSGSSIEGDFGLAPDSTSEAGPFSFYHTADFQFDSPRSSTEQIQADLADMEKFAKSHDIRFYAVCGDITTHGEVDDLAFFNEQFDRLARPVYRIFGGHDALVEMPRPKMGNWVDAFGPYTYAWNHGGVHFIALVSEGYLSDDERARQTRFWQRDMAALAPETPIVLLAHTPDQISAEIGEAIREHSVIAYLFGHWHTHHSYEVDGVPFFTSSPMRPSDWGGFTKRTRAIRYESGTLSSTSRVLEQRQRIHVLQPHGTVAPGPLKIRAHVYDTAKIPEKVEAQISNAQDGSRFSIPLHQENGFTWTGSLVEAVPTGMYTILVEAGEGWVTEASFQVTQEPPGIETKEDWRDTFGSGARSRSPETALSPAPRLQWVATLPSDQPHQTTPLILDGHVYLGVSDLQAGAAHAGVVCIDGNTGETRWTRQLPHSINSGICSDGERIFAVDGQGGIYALSPESGEILWQADAYADTPFHEERRYYWRTFLAPATTANGRLFVAGSYVLAAFDTTNGKRMWSNYDDLCRNAYPMSGLAPAGELVFFENESHVVALAQETGEIRWTRALADLTGGVSRERGTATPLATSEAVYFHHRSRVRTLIPSTGEEIWSASSGGSMNYMGIPAKARDAVIVTSGRNVICIESATGERRWAAATRTANDTDLGPNQDLRNGAAPLVVGDWVIVGSDDGYVYVFSVANGEKSWEYNTGAPIKASPAISGNLVVVNNFAGNIFGIVLEETGE